MAKATMTYSSKSNLEKGDANRSAEVSGKLKSMLGSEVNKLGHMPEHAGGGQPISAGSTWEKESSKKRAPQPFDPETGKFTNNSMNFRNLDYKPQRSSGKSMHQVFGGVKDVFEKGSVITTDKAERMILSADFTKDDLIRAMHEYNEKEQRFVDDDYAPTVRKKGRSSKAERESIERGGDVLSKIDVDKLSENTRNAIEKAKEEFANKKAGWAIGKNKAWLVDAPLKGNSTSIPQDTPFDVETAKSDPQKFAKSKAFRVTYNELPDKAKEKLKPGFFVKHIINGDFKKVGDINAFVRRRIN